MNNTKQDKGLAKRFQSLLKNNSGNVSMVFAALGPMLGVVIGLGIDSARLANEQVAFHSSVDAAALAVAADTRSTNPNEQMKVTLKTFAQNYITANYIPSNANAVNVTVDSLVFEGTTIKIKAKAQYPTAFAKFIGVTTYNLESDSEAKTNTQASARAVELVMVMDVTGSMSSSSGGSGTVSKIEAAKTAARNLMTTIYGGPLSSKPDNMNIRTALVPFSAAVMLNKNAFDFNPAWIDQNQSNPLSTGSQIVETTTYVPGGGRRGSGGYYVTTTSTETYNKYNGSSWSGCVEARAGGTTNPATNYNENDVAPSTGVPATLFPAFYNYDSSDNDSNCPDAPLVPMTYKRSNVESGIDAMAASGSTLIPEGLNWGWRAISPTEPLTKVEAGGSNNASTISPYNDVKWHKVMVLMTDGDNQLQSTTHNGSSSTKYSAYGYSNEPIIAQNRFGQMINTDVEDSANVVLDQVTLRTCNAIKASGVELYVAAFGTGISTTSLANLQACATDPEHYVHAVTGSELTTFFQAVGNDINVSTIYVSK